MRLKIALAVSLLLNLMLGVNALRQTDGPRVGVTELEPAGEPTPAQVYESRQQEEVPLTITGTPARRMTWETVESEDYREYIANLSAIGCPEETIRDIIIADVNKLFDQKKRELRGEPRRFEYWKAGNPFMGGGLDAEYMRKSRELDAEMNAVLRELGIEPDYRTQIASMVNPVDVMFDFLPEDKRVRVMNAMTEMAAQMAEVAEGGRLDPEDMFKVQQERERSIKAMLTPEEALEYDLRMSVTANTLRNSIGGFDPSEEEFLAVFHLRKGFDEEFHPMLWGSEYEEQRQRRQEAEKLLNDQIRQALGDARYEDYTRAQQWDFQQFHRSAQRARLDTSRAIEAHEIKKLAEESVHELRMQANLDQAARRAALTAIREETELSLRQTLGEEGWEHYNRGHNTHWLQNIAPPDPPPVQPTQVP